MDLGSQVRPGSGRMRTVAKAAGFSRTLTPAWHNHSPGGHSSPRPGLQMGQRVVRLMLGGEKKR